MIRSPSKKYLSCFLMCMPFFAWMLSGSSLSAEEGKPENAAAEEVIRAGYLDPEQKKQLALANTLKAHETVWLDVLYPETEEPEKVLAIAKSSLIADKQGAILLLHDKEQHADWPQIIRPLRTTLPKYGWFTLAVNLPDEIRIQLPERVLGPKTLDQINLTDALKRNLDSGVRTRLDETSSNGDQAGNSDPEGEASEVDDNTQVQEDVDINLAAASKNERPKIPYNIRALSHIEKAIDYLNNQSYENIVLLAYRHSSELAWQYIKAHQGELTSPGFALVLIEPSLPEDYLRDVTEWFGAGFKPPILDIVNSGEERAEEQAQLRKLAFERADVQTYRQIFLPVSNSDIFHDTLSRRIRFWLDGVAPGMSVTQ